jgi:hypothetical protein
MWSFLIQRREKYCQCTQEAIKWQGCQFDQNCSHIACRLCISQPKGSAGGHTRDAHHHLKIYILARSPVGTLALMHCFWRASFTSLKASSISSLALLKSFWWTKEFPLAPPPPQIQEGAQIHIFSPRYLRLVPVFGSLGDFASDCWGRGGGLPQQHELVRSWSTSQMDVGPSSILVMVVLRPAISELHFSIRDLDCHLNLPQRNLPQRVWDCILILLVLDLPDGCCTTLEVRVFKRWVMIIMRTNLKDFIFNRIPI